MKTPFRLICLLLVSLLNCCGLHSQETRPDAEELLRALGSAQFSERERAMTQLWSLGLDVQPALEALLQSGDAEIRHRASRVLQDFDYGILPQTPLAIRQQIRQFRDGDPVARNQAFEGLLKRRHYSIVETLISKQGDPNGRIALLAAMFRMNDVVQDYADLERVSSLVRRVGADQTPTWCQSTEAGLLFSELLMTEFARTDQLTKLHQYLLQKDANQIRPLYLKTFFGSLQTMGILAQNGQIEFAFDVLAIEGDLQRRSELGQQLGTNPFVARGLLERGEFLTFVEQLQQQVEQSATDRVITSAFQSSNAAELMLEHHGFEALLKITNEIDELAARGAVLGDIMSNASVIQHLRAEDNLAHIVDLATGFPEQGMRQSYVRALLKSNLLQTLEDDESASLMRSIWRLVEACDDTKIQEEAFTRLIRLPVFVRILRDKGEAKKLFAMMSDMDPKLLEIMVSRLTYNSEALKLLSDKPLLIEMVNLVGKVPAWRRTRVLSRLFSKPEVFSDLSSEQQRKLLSEVAQELQPAYRCDFVAALLQSRLAHTSQGTRIANELLDGLLDLPDNVRGRALEAISSSYRGSIWIDNQEKMRWVIGGLDSASPETVQRLFATIINDSNRRHLFFAEDHFGALVEQIDRLDAERAQGVMRMVTASPEFVRWFQRGGNEERFVELIQGDGQSERRLGALQGVFANSMVMPVLIESGKFDLLLETIGSFADDQLIAQLQAELLQSEAAIEHVVATGREDLILAFANPRWSEQQRVDFLVRILQNGKAVQRIIQANQFDAVLAMVSDNRSGVRRRELLDKMLSSPVTTSELIRRHKLLELFDQAASDPAAPRGFVARLLVHPEALENFSQHGRLAELLQWVSSSLVAAQRQNALRAICYSTDALSQLIALNGLSKYLEIVAVSEKDPGAGLAYSLLSRESAVSLIINAGRLKDLLDMIDASNEVVASRLCMALLRHPTVWDVSAKHQRVDQLLAVVERFDNDVLRSNVINQLLSNRYAIQSVSQAGYLSHLLSWVDEQPDPRKKKSWLAFITRGVGAGPMIEAGRIDVILESLDSQSGVSLVQALVSDHASVQQLRESGHFDALLQLCLESSYRSTLLASLMQSTSVVRHLDLETQVIPWLDDLVHANPLQRETIRSIIQQPKLRQLTDQRGWFEAVITALRSPDPSFHDADQQLVELLCTEEGVRWLASKNQTDLVLNLVSRQTQVSRANLQLSRLGRSPELLEWLFKHKTVQEIEQFVLNMSPAMHAMARNYLMDGSLAAEAWILGDQSEGYVAYVKDIEPVRSRNIISSLLRSQKVALTYDNANVLQAMVELVSHVEPTYQASYFDRLLSNGLFRWQHFSLGKHAELFELASKCSNPEEVRENLRFAVNGQVAYEIYQGRHEPAEQLLIKHATDLVGYQRLASYYLQRDILTERCGDLSDGPLLAYLLACDGQQERASELFAQRTETLRLAAMSLLEKNKWTQIEAFERLAQQANQAPSTELLAMYQLIGGKVADENQELQQLLDIGNAHSSRVKWLLLNGQPLDAVKLVGDPGSELTFDILCNHGRIEEALKEIGASDSKAIATWYRQGLVDEQRVGLEKMRFAVRVLEQLYRFGKLELAGSLRALLVADLTDRTDRESQLLGLDCASVLKHAGENFDAVQLAVRDDRSTSTLNMAMARLHPHGWNQRYEELSTWWQHFSRYPTRMPGHTAGRTLSNRAFFPVLAAILTGDENTILENQQSVGSLVRQEIYFRLTQDPNASIATMLLTLARLGDVTTASALMEDFLKPTDEAYPLLLRTVGRWADAADAFMATWENEPANLEYLYLSGEALSKSGRDLDGHKRMQQASSMAVSSSGRLRLAQRLEAHGAINLALKEYDLVYRSALPGDVNRITAGERLTVLAPEQFEVAKQATNLAERVLGSLPTAESVADLIQLESLMVDFHRSQAQDAQGVVATQRHLELALASRPGDIRLSEFLVPTLNENGASGVADSLFDQQERTLLQWIDDHPRSANFQNDLAWLYARLQRKLVAAQRYAEAAVDLAPQSVAYRDTLAEVYYQRGLNQQALEEIRKAIDIEPRNPYLQRQEKRFLKTNSGQ